MLEGDNNRGKECVGANPHSDRPKYPLSLDRICMLLLQGIINPVRSKPIYNLAAGET